MKKQRIAELLNSPRMSYASTDNRINRVIGLKMLIDDYVTELTEMVEIGSFAGVSSELFALHCKKISCVDEWNPYWEIKMEDIIKEAEAKFDILVSKYSNITKIKQSSILASGYFQNESLDLIYIDAAHDYDSVKQDIIAWYPKVKIGGVLAGHDYNYDPNIKVYQVVNEIFAHSHKIEIYPDSSWLIIK